MGKKSPDASKGEPSLELPSFGLRGRGRKKKSTEPAAAVPPQEPADDEPTTALLVEETPIPDTSEEAPTEPIEPIAGGGGATPRAKRGGFSFPSMPSMPSMPPIPGLVAAIVTGLVVGAFGTGLTYLAMTGCEAIRGASTCGRAGFFPLVAILILMSLLGGVMLKFAKVSDPGSTSFLAVALLGVIALLALTDVIFSVWMFLIVPILCAPAYALSHWVTTRFVEEPDRPESHDLR